MLEYKFMRESIDVGSIIIESVQENVHAKKQYKIHGPFIMVEKKNQNGRKYQQAAMLEAVTEYDDKYIKLNRAVGELNHPKTVDVDFDRACHNVVELKQDGNVWIGKSQVLHGMPKGDILAALLDNKIKIGVSTRGLGHLVESTKEVDKYILKAVDIVHDPSGNECFVDVMLESKTFLINEHGNIMEHALKDLSDNLINIPKHSDEKALALKRAIEKFLRQI